MNHSNVDHGLACDCVAFIVFVEAPISAQPAKGALDNPSSRQDYEALDTHGPQHCLEEPSTAGVHPFDQLAGIAAIGPNELQARQILADFFQNQPRPVTILDICRMNDDGQYQPEGVYQEVPFSA